MYANFKCVQLSSISWSGINFVYYYHTCTCKCMYIVIIIILHEVDCGHVVYHMISSLCVHMRCIHKQMCVTGLLKSFALPYATKLGLRSCIVILDVGILILILYFSHIGYH